MPVCDVTSQITTAMVWPRKRRALWRAVGGHQAGFPDRGVLGAGDAQAGSFEIRPGLLRTTRTDRMDIQPVTLGEGVRHAGFNLRSKSRQNGEGGSGERSNSDG